MQLQEAMSSKFAPTLAIFATLVASDVGHHQPSSPISFSLLSK